MSQTRLKRLLGKRSSLGSVLRQIIRAYATPIDVLDLDGSLLLGTGSGGQAPQRVPILLQGKKVGWVVGAGMPEQLAAIAELVSYAAEQESQKRSLASEVLERYRELNLLYTLSGKLAASPEPASIAGMALDEASRLIQALAGLVLFMCDGETCLEPVAEFGLTLQPMQPASQPALVVRRVVGSGRAELVNGIPAEGLLATVQEAGLRRVSLLCAPLKTETSSLGAILLVREFPEAFVAEELKLLNTISLQAAPALEIARLHQVAIENARMERELQMARQVQANLIPSQMPQPPGWQFAAEWHPAREVAGDYYDIIAEEDGHLSFVIADVTDKGMPASLFMVFTRSALRTSVNQSCEPAEGISRANHLITLESGHGLFVTLFYARLNPDTGELTYVNAGHNPPLFYQAATAQIMRLTRTGLALGLVGDFAYEQRTIGLDTGDLVLLYTDGVTEAFDADRNQFGEQRLAKLVMRHHHVSPNELVSAIMSEITRFASPAITMDDVTIVAIKRL